MSAISTSIVQDIDVPAAYGHLLDGRSGAINVFVGTVRDLTEDREAIGLDFETYEEMALREMRKLVKEATERFKLNKAVLWHATGHKVVMEPVVFVGASAPHRDAAFKACRYMIDTLKTTVPIWKKEFFKDGAVWVNAHP